MLPILRYLPVGGVFIAMLALVLGFSVPGAWHSRVLYEPPVRGASVRPEPHPELRHMLLLAAARRAGELQRVNTLSGAPAGWPLSRFAGLPGERIDADPEDVTGSLPGSTIPIDIGATSSTELPLTKPEERLDQPIKQPERTRPDKESKRAPARKPRKPAAKPETTPAFDLLGAIFGGGVQKPRGVNSATENQANRPGGGAQ